MGYPDIKDSEYRMGTAFLLGVAFYPQAVIAPFAAIWAVVYFGFGIRELWLSLVVTGMVSVAIACFAFYFYADAIERSVARRKARFRKS